MRRCLPVFLLALSLQAALIDYSNAEFPVYQYAYDCSKIDCAAFAQQHTSPALAEHSGGLIRTILPTDFNHIPFIFGPRASNNRGEVVGMLFNAGYDPWVAGYGYEGQAYCLHGCGIGFFVADINNNGLQLRAEVPGGFLAKLGYGLYREQDPNVAYGLIAPQLGVDSFTPFPMRLGGYGISDSGQFIGIVEGVRNGQIVEITALFSPTPIPEPGSLLLVAGGAWLMWRRFQRRQR